MKRKNLTRNALFTSVLSLLLCVSMLVGTTFAWFTDEVQSGRNTIAAGNLDIELLANGNQVKSDTKLFNLKDAADNDTWWEPGMVVYENLQIKNVGTLALKYQMALNFYGENDLNGHKLSEVLQVAVLNETIDASAMTRAQVLEKAKASSQVGALSNFKLSGELEAKTDGAAFAVVIYWAPNANDVDNLYNANNGQTTSDGQPLHITFGVNLLATQKMSENDSFGPDYDENAWHNAMKVASEQDLNAAIANGESKIVLENDIALTKTLEIPAGTAVKLNLSGYELSGNKTKDSGAAIVNNGTLSIYGGEMSNNAVNGAAVIENNGSLTLDGVTVKGAPMDSTGYPEYAVVTYGKLTVEEGTAIVADRGAIRTYAGAEVVINGGSFTVSNAADGRNMTIHTIYAYGNGAKLTINDGYFEQNHTSTGGASVICPAGASIDIYGGDFRDAMDDTNWTSTGNFQNYMGYTAPVNVYGGTFDDATVNKNLASGYKAVVNNGVYLVIPADRELVADGVQQSADNKTFFLTSKEGFEWMESQSDNYFAGKTITLEESIDFGGETIDAIRFWNPENKTIFDGNGKTISNFVLENTDGNAGLFNGTMTVQNLNVTGAKVTGMYVGVIAGNLYGDIINCTVTESVINGTYWQTGALVGQYNGGNIIDCKVESCTINGLAAVGGLVGILNETTGERNIENCTVKNCAIAQTGSFGGSYDDMFGVVTGIVNIANSTVTITGTYENNTVKGVASDVLCGVVKDSTKVYVITTADNGVKLMKDAVTGVEALYDTADYTGDTLEVPAGVQAIGNYAFAYNNTIETVVLPASVTDLGRGFDSSSVKKVVLNEGLETISSRAFRSTSALKEVVIPSTVKEIADNAFQKSAIKEVVIPANVETIGEAAFGSSKIEKVTFEGNTSIQGYAFRGCPNLREVHLKGDNVTFIASTLNGRNSMWFCNGESNNPNTSNITFYVVNKTVAARVKTAMGAEANNTKVYVNGVLYEG